MLASSLGGSTLEGKVTHADQGCSVGFRSCNWLSVREDGSDQMARSTRERI